MASVELQLGINGNSSLVESKFSPDFLQLRQATIDAFARNITEQGLIAALLGRFKAVFSRDAGLATCVAMEKEQNGESHTLQEGARRTLITGAENQGTRYQMVTREMKGEIIHEHHGPDSDQEHLTAIARSKHGGWVRQVNGHYEGKNYRGLDPTLWWISLLATYIERSQDYALMEKLWPNLEAAVAWTDRYGTKVVKLIKGGYEHHKPPRNLGWKDSEDAFVKEDGTFPDYPVAPLDVQCVAYVADIKAAQLYDLKYGLMGNKKDQKKASTLRSRAEQRQELIDRLFWLDEYGVYAPAVDVYDQPVRVRTSDSAYALWAGVTNGRSAGIARTMQESDLFIPGHGLLARSISSRQFSPRHYHDDLWYHLAPLAAAGCDKFGLHQEAAVFDTCVPTIIEEGFPEVSAVDREGKISPYTEIDPETGEEKQVSCKNFTMAIGTTLNRLAA